MQPALRREGDRLLQRLLELPEDQRVETLNRVCEQDQQLKSLVERLLAQAETDESDFRVGAGLKLFGVETSDFAPHTTTPRLGERVGPFELVKILGAGGMATVYLAKRVDGQFEQQVALKVLDRLGDSRERFEQERQILASLDHPNIARLLDGGVTDDGVPYVAMEYIEGEPLLEYCDRHRLPVRERLLLFVKIASAVHEAHRRLIVHRDIKSSNVLVSDAGVPKLLDFGIAKLLEIDALPHAAPATRMAAPMTPEYASPEQIRGDPMTVATDVYQLGYLLYLMLTDMRPFDLKANDMAALISAITGVAAIPLSKRITEFRPEIADSKETPWSYRGTTQTKLCRQLRGDMEQIVQKAMHKDAAQRYRSAESLAVDLENFLASRPIVARPDSVRYRTGRFIHRHAVGVAISALIAVVAIGGTSLFIYQLSRAKTATEIEAAKSEEVASFMRDLFGAANPAIAAGEVLTARQVLDKGMEEIRSRLDDQPDVKAELLYHMGYAYMELGSLPVAEEVLLESLRYRESSKTNESPGYYKSLNVLAHVYRAQGRYADAEVAARRAYDGNLSLLGEGNKGTLDSLSTLGLSIYRQSRFDEAEAIQRRKLALTRQHLGTDHPDIVGSLNNVAIVLYMQGRFGEAGDLHQEAYELGKRLLGEKHPATMDALNNLALDRDVSGESEEAEKHYLEVIRLRSNVLGELHPRTLRSQQHLAAMQLAHGDAEAALSQLLSLQDARLELLGAEHPDTLWTKQAIGVAYAVLNRSSEAEEHLMQVLAVRERTLGREHHDTLLSHTELGRFLRDEARYEESEVHLQAALAGNVESNGAESDDTVLAQIELGHLYSQWGRLDSAAAFLEDAMSQLDNIEQEGDVHARLLYGWGDYLRRTNRAAEAEAALSEGYRLLVKVYGPRHPVSMDAAKSLQALEN